MSLSVESLSFRNFRNYRCFSLEDIGRITLLVGPNAVGKTNVVEGIQLLTAIASFRHPKLSYLVREGATSAQARMTVGDGSRELSVDMIVEEGKRRYLLNGKPRKARNSSSPKEGLPTHPMTMVSPENISGAGLE